MNALRVVIGMAGLALLGVVVWAFFDYPEIHGDFFQQLGVVISLPWGRAGLVDLYVGFLIFATLVFITERSWLRAAAWALPVFVLGNIWAALWFVLRLPDLVQRLSRPAPPSS